MDQSPEQKQPYFPEVEQGKKLSISREQIPWMRDENEELSLVKITTDEGQEFYLGSLVTGKKLIDVANQLSPEQNEIANGIFYRALPDIIHNRTNRFIRPIREPKTEEKIMYVHNIPGQRVYYIRFGQEDGIPVIIRLAVCNKAQEDDVLSVISKR